MEDGLDSYAPSPSRMPDGAEPAPPPRPGLCLGRGQEVQTMPKLPMRRLLVWSVLGAWLTACGSAGGQSRPPDRDPDPPSDPGDAGEPPDDPRAQDPPDAREAPADRA